jgi:erythromycin esterase-like protein
VVDLAVCLALLLATACAPQGGLSRAEQAVVAWAAERAIPLETFEPHALDPLERELAGVRVVMLGEPDHFIHEKNDVRLLLIRWLFGRGFRHVGMEMGHSDAWRMDRYLATGDEAWLERVALYGYGGDRRPDRRDAVEGWTQGQDEELARRVNAESRWLLRELRALNAGLPEGTPRLEWFGYDVSFAPGGGYADARRLLEPHQGEAAVRDALTRLERVEGESRAAEIARLDALAAWLGERRAELERSLGAADARELTRMVRNLADSLRWVEAAALPRGSPERRSGLVEREQAMMRSVDERLAALTPGQGLVLLGHDLHLSRASGALTLAGEPLWETIGTHLAGRSPEGVHVLWTLFDQGRHGVPGAQPALADVDSVPGSVEALLARAGERFVLPLGPRDELPRWLLRERAFLRGARGVLPDQADTVVFLREVSAPRER